MSDLLSEKQSISSAFFRNLDDTTRPYMIDSAGNDRGPHNKPFKDDDGKVKKFDRASSKNRESMSVLESNITRELESSINLDAVANKLDILDEELKIQRPTGSSTSKDEGVSSNGDKDDNNIDEDDEEVYNAAVETDDEGRGSWMGDKNRDDSDLVDIDTIHKAVSDEVASEEVKKNADTYFQNLDDSGKATTIGDFHNDIDANISDVEAAKIATEAEQEYNVADELEEAKRQNATVSDDDAIEYAVIMNQNDDIVPDDKETQDTNKEDHEEEVIEYADLDHRKNETDSLFEKEKDETDIDYNGDVEDTPSRSMMDRNSFYTKMEKDVEEEKNATTDMEEESKVAKERNSNLKNDATGSSEEVAAENVAAKPLRKKVKPRKKRSHGIIDLDKINANRIPISTRAAPHPVPISRKKENANQKPRPSDKFVHMDMKKLKQRARKKRTINFSETKNPVSDENSAEINSNMAVEIPSQPLVTIESMETNSEDPTQGQKQEEGIAPEKGGISSFLNPLMDHTLERPVAPHKRVRHKTSEHVAANKGSRVSDAMAVKNPNAEVWVPGEDKLYVYSYSSAPRLLHVKRLGSKRVATTTVNDTDPNSSFRIKNRNGRVIRGTNYGKDGAPKWNPYFAYARCLSQNDYSFYETDEIRQRREEFRKRMKDRATVRRDTIGNSSVYQTPSGLTTGNQASLEPTVSPEEAIIKALVANTLREAIIEVHSEAERDAAKLENLVTRRLSTMGEESSTNEENYESDNKNKEPAEDDVREDPEGMETSPNDEELPSSVKEREELK